MFDESAGRIYQVWYRFRRARIWMTWSDVLEVSPNAIHPNLWPEPDGIFFGWNRVWS